MSFNTSKSRKMAGSSSRDGKLKFDELDAKMRVTFRIEGKTLVIEKAAGEDNPLDGIVGRKLDQDLFGKIAQEQEERKRRQLDVFGDKIQEAAEDDTPPDHPFGRD